MRGFVLSLASLCVAAAFADGVKVSERFGFDPADSTRFVQAAIDAGLPEIVLDRKTSPWVVTPLKARSGMRLVFEDGAELVAKKGAYRDVHDMVFSMQFLTNVAIVGRGVHGGTIRMHKTDYQNPPYARSEWRHAIWFSRCTNVLVENMTLASSGGDGIEISGNSANVTIRSCICDDNHRQGISVLSATDLLIEDCVLKNTKGTPPMAGIDWEPDAPSDALVRCVMRRCRVENNAGNGIEFYFGKSTGATKPLDVTISDCHVVGCRTSAVVGGGVSPKDSHPQGLVTYSNCIFESPCEAGIMVRSKPIDAFQLVFADCTVSNAQGRADVLTGIDRWDLPPVGGVAFPKLKVFRDRPGRRFGTAGLGGWPADKLPPRCDFWKEDDVEVVDAKPGELVTLSGAILQDAAPYVFFADRAGTVRFRGRQILRGSRGRAAAGPVRVSRMLHPSRPKWKRELPSPGLEGGVIEFEVPGRGWYFMTGPSSSSVRFLLEASNVPVGLNLSSGSPFVLPADRERPLSFWIPAAREEPFAVLASGCDESCTVKLSVFGPDGAPKGQADSIHDWTPLATAAGPGGLFRVEASRPAKGFYFAFKLDVVGAPGLVLLTDEKTLRRR